MRSKKRATEAVVGAVFPVFGTDNGDVASGRRRCGLCTNARPTAQEKTMLQTLRKCRGVFTKFHLVGLCKCIQGLGGSTLLALFDSSQMTFSDTSDL